MGHKKNPRDLAKFLSYALGRHPEEFGLILDGQGYVKIKALLKALSEEDGWKYVRRSHLDEIILTQPVPSVEIRENHIRAADRSRLNTGSNGSEGDIPGHLFTCIRQRAHAYVLENGISPAGSPHVVLSPDEDMAQRIGRRIDASPVLITVQIAKCREQGIHITRDGDTLFHADFIPVGCFIAPPLPKQKMEAKKAAADKKKEKAPKEEKFFAPGSFFPDFSEEDEKKQIQKQRKKDKVSRDKEKRKARKMKWDSRE